MRVPSGNMQIQRPAASFRARPLLFGALTALFLVLAITGLLAAS